jgi:hypothetical protein
MPRAHPLFLEIAAQLRELAHDPQVEWSYYIDAQNEMIDAGLDENDAVYVLQNGKITQGETRGERWRRRYRIEVLSDGVHAAFSVRFSFGDEKWIEIIAASRINE